MKSLSSKRSASVATTSQLMSRVIDGPIRNALVCLDANANGACDAGEPAARSNAAGDAVLEVPTADVGKYVVLAVVGTEAVDADSGPVTVPFTMKAPADSAAVVSPLTTLVQAHAATPGSSTTQAETFVKAQTGLSGSLLADCTAASDAGVVGQRDLSGAAITETDVRSAIAAGLLNVLPALGAAATDIVTSQSSLTAATAASTTPTTRPRPTPGTATGASVTQRTRRMAGRIPPCSAARGRRAASRQSAHRPAGTPSNSSSKVWCPRPTPPACDWPATRMTRPIRPAG